MFRFLTIEKLIFTTEKINFDDYKFIACPAKAL